ncbi:MAG: radical SAM protein [Deltaproteobacteria bacterium]|nr:radical SAM protein [Deltaproteobacteria bacterium]
MNAARRWRAFRALAAHDRLFYAHVGATHRCNMRCRMCTVPERGDVEREADPAKFRIVAKELAELGCAVVSIGGGEPMLHRDLPGIVEAFAREGMRVRVLTNGITGSRPTIRALANAGATDMSVSLDSLDPVAQARLEDLPGILPKKMETIAAITHEMPRGTHILNAIVTPQTLPGLRRVARFAGEIGYFSSFIPIHLAASEVEHHFFSDALDLGFAREHREELRAFYGDLARGHVGGVINSRVYLENSLRYLLGEPFDWSCHAGVLYVSVDPSARISICHQFEETDTVEAEGFAERYLRGDWRRRAREASAPCRACYRPCWAEIDHFAENAEAFLGALGTQARGLLRSLKPRAAEEITAIAEEIAGDTIRMEAAEIRVRMIRGNA